MQERDRRPNIIFVLTDDQRWDALGTAGNEAIHTPQMDRLAASGTMFDRAFVTTPICAASRASILTGLYERTHTYTFLQGDIRQEFMTESYPAKLKGAGYYTGFFGKFGVEYPDFGTLFDEAENYDRNDDFRDYRGYFYKTVDEDTVHLTRYTGQQAVDFIMAAPRDRPFMLSLSFSAPHAHDLAEEQYFWSSDFDSLYAGWTAPPPNLSDPADFTRQPEYVRAGENRNRWHWRFETPEKYQRSVKGYYRMISEVDAEIGKIREALRVNGLASNTVIILMGDNGYFLGERQLAGKWLMYEESIRVPLIVYDPRSHGGRRDSSLALNIDVPVTILDFAGLPSPDSWEGVSLLSDELADRSEFLIEHLWDVSFIPPSEGIRTDRWKYFRYIKDPEHEEMYDLLQDPSEGTNLAGDTLHAAQLDSLRARMDRLLTR